MLTVVLAFQIVILLALAYSLLRKSTIQPNSNSNSEDPRLAQLLASDLPATLARAEARGDALDQHLRAELAQLRTEAATEAARGRDAANAASAALRTEVLGNINTLGVTQRSSMDAQLCTLTQSFTGFTTDSTRHATDARDALHRRLNELSAAQTDHQDKLRATVEQRLDALNANNEKKLEEMRSTVDEKLHVTLQTRLTESFGAVTDQLSKVHAGLGEMNTLSTGVNDLNRIFSNVKSRGGFAEVQLGKLLEQVLAPGQYVENARVRPGTQEVVEFAVRFPGTGGDVLLPIDAKFPREDWERLESAYESGLPASVEPARKAFDAAIRTEGKRICAKYINEPITTPYAIMFLPTEGLYAEVLRRDGLQADLHQNCRVMVAGPSNLYALLTSFQLGFRMLNLQKKGNEVWNVLAKTQTEFKTFETLMGSMEKQVGTVQSTIQKLNVRTRAINRTLGDVSADSPGPALDSGANSGAFDGLLPMLAANEDT